MHPVARFGRRSFGNSGSVAAFDSRVESAWLSVCSGFGAGWIFARSGDAGDTAEPTRLHARRCDHVFLFVDWQLDFAVDLPDRNPARPRTVVVYRVARRRTVVQIVSTRAHARGQRLRAVSF